MIPEEEKHDEELRAIFLSQAIESCAGIHFNPDYIVAIAQDFYKFLKGEEETK